MLTPPLPYYPRYVPYALTWHRRSNVGILCGEPSGNLADVDLDVPEAVTLARVLLPHTGMVHGRRSNPCSHYWYIAEVNTVNYRFTFDGDEEPTMLVEVRSAGRQTVVPPSTHPDGEAYTWHRSAEPTVVEPAMLQRAVAQVASGTLIARHWPGEGSRDEAALALSGMLLRCGWSEDETSQFVQYVAKAAGDEEWRERDKAARTAEKLRTGNPVTGSPKLGELLRDGHRVVSKVREWLQLSGPTAALAAAPSWPDPPRGPALHGLAGDVVRLLERHTESDPAALLLQFLVYFGSVIGTRPHFMHESTRHALNLYCVLVGPAGHGRKGTSRDRIQTLFHSIDENWAANRVLSGLSSGEGLIAVVRDYENDSTAPQDKRTLVFESEFAGPLQQMGRDGNILSVTLRQLWDSDAARTLTRADPLRATGVHLALIGHITRDDLVRYMTSTLAGNGLGNRILWAAVRRSKELPFGGDVHPDGMDNLLERLGEVVAFAQGTDCMSMSEDARMLWIQAYTHLSRERPGLFGKLTSRAEAQTRRLACLYALLDKRAEVDTPHLLAALALWEFCERSVLYTFGDALGERLADAILARLRSIGVGGMTTTEIHNALGNNVRAAEIRRALESLVEHQLVTHRAEPSQGRGTKPTDRWVATERQGNPYAVTNYEFNESSPSGSDVVSNSLAPADPGLDGIGGIGDIGETCRELTSNVSTRVCLKCRAPMKPHPDGGYILTCACGTSNGRVA